MTSVITQLANARLGPWHPPQAEGMDDELERHRDALIWTARSFRLFAFTDWQQLFYSLGAYIARYNTLQRTASDVLLMGALIHGPTCGPSFKRDAEMPYDKPTDSDIPTVLALSDGYACYHSCPFPAPAGWHAWLTISSYCPTFDVEAQRDDNAQRFAIRYGLFPRTPETLRAQLRQAADDVHDMATGACGEIYRVSALAETLYISTGPA